MLPHLCIFSAFIHIDHLQVLTAWAFKSHPWPSQGSTDFHILPVYCFNLCWYPITVKIQLSTYPLHTIFCLYLWAKYELKHSPFRCLWDSSKIYAKKYASVQSLGIQLNLGPSTVLNKTTLNIYIAPVFGLVFASNYIGRWIYSLEGVRRLRQKFWVELIC